MVLHRENKKREHRGSVGGAAGGAWSFSWKTGLTGRPHLTFNSITLDNHLILLILNLLFCLSGIKHPSFQVVIRLTHVQYFDCKAFLNCLVYKIEKHLTLYCAGKQSINKTLKEAKKKKKSYMKCFRNCKALSTLGGDVIIRDLGLRERLPFLCCPSSPFGP